MAEAAPGLTRFRVWAGFAGFAGFRVRVRPWEREWDGAGEGSRRPAGGGERRDLKAAAV
jgi:hypothetical protein